MKKIIKFSLMLVVALITINVHAGNVDFSLNVKKGQGKMVRFTLNEVNKMDLSIYDANGKVIHTENVNSKGNLNRTYDLNSLPEGTYFLEAESEFKIAKYEISVDGDSAVLAPNAFSEVFKPVFVIKNGLVLVSIANFERSPVAIILYDAENNEVYNSGILLGQNVKKIFDIKNVNSEIYTFVITYDNKTFTKNFPIR